MLHPRRRLHPLSTLIVLAACGGGGGGTAAPTPAAFLAPGFAGGLVVPIVGGAVSAPVEVCAVRVHGTQALAELRGGEGGHGIVLAEVPLHDAAVVLATEPVRTASGLRSQHHKAIVAGRDGDGAGLPTTAVTARFGLRAELTPLLDPCALGAGDTLPLRLSLDVGDPGGVTLHVRRRVGPRLVDAGVVVTRALGYADIPLREPGEYIVHADARLGHGDREVELALVTLSFPAGGGR